MLVDTPQSSLPPLFRTLGTSLPRHGCWHLHSALQDTFNILDAIIVIVSMVELGLQGGGISVFRALRLLRVFKMLNRWKGLRMLISVTLEAIAETGVDVGTCRWKYVQDENNPLPRQFFIFTVHPLLPFSAAPTLVYRGPGAYPHDPMLRGGVDSRLLVAWPQFCLFAVEAYAQCLSFLNLSFNHLGFNPPSPSLGAAH